MAIVEIVAVEIDEEATVVTTAMMAIAELCSMAVFHRVPLY